MRVQRGTKSVHIMTDDVRGRGKEDQGQQQDTGNIRREMQP